MSGSNTDSEQRDEAGRKLYETDPRVPPWESLSERQREGWRQDADARLAGQSTASQPTHVCKGEKCEAWDDARNRFPGASAAEESAFVAGWHVHAEGRDAAFIAGAQKLNREAKRFLDGQRVTQEVLDRIIRAGDAPVPAPTRSSVYDFVVDAIADGVQAYNVSVSRTEAAAYAETRFVHNQQFRDFLALFDAKPSEPNRGSKDSDRE